MRHYELMVILDPDLEERTINPSLDTFLNVVRKDGGTVEKVDVWGRRRLAQEIDKKVEGIYAVVDLSAEPATMKELDRQLNLNESILRTKVMRPDLRASKPAAGKSPKPSSAVGASGPSSSAPSSSGPSSSAPTSGASASSPASGSAAVAAAPKAVPAEAPEPAAPEPAALEAAAPDTSAPEAAAPADASADTTAEGSDSAS